MLVTEQPCICSSSRRRDAVGGPFITLDRAALPGWPKTRGAAMNRRATRRPVKRPDGGPPAIR
jgi:hypothetical protein